MSYAETMNYVPRYYADIFLDLLTNAYTAGLLSDDADFLDIVNQNQAIENDIVLELSVHALILAEAYLDLTRIYNARNIKKATLADLDDLGSMFFARRPSYAAIGEVTLGRRNPATENISVPLGSQVFIDDGSDVVFTTTGEGTLLAGTTSVTVPIMCTQTGIIGNVGKNKINALMQSIAGIETVTNANATTGGKPAETDDEYRLRLMRWKTILRKGTLDAIIEGITSVSAVTGYYVDRFFNGYGTTRIIIDPPTQQVMNLVENSLESWKAVDDYYLVVGVEEVVVDISGIINVSIDETLAISDVEKEAIRLKVVQALTTYIDGGEGLDGNRVKDLGIGNDFIPFRAGIYLSEMIPEIKDVTFSYPQAPITIANHQKAVAGTFTITVV